MTDNNLYDVGIIGGGLAGLSLAIQCANANYKVVVFEKEGYPFHKVCGEYISLESWNHLQSLGLHLQDWNLPIFKKLTLSDVNGHLYHFNLPLGGFGISRYKLDFALYELAIKKGVTFFTNTKVNDVDFVNEQFIIQCSNGNIHVQLAAGSFGKRSNLDVKWNRPFIQQKPSKLENYIGVKYHIKYNHAIDEIALHNFKNGYCGMSKIEDNTSCLCYLTTAKNLQQSGNSIEQMEQEILYKNPVLKNIFSNAAFIYKQPLVISQVSFSSKNQIENHVLLLGDAAGMITPLCGNGMSMALHSSVIAFDKMNCFLQKTMTRHQMELAFTEAWQQQFKWRLQIGRLVQSVFGNNLSTTLFLKLMKALPFLARIIIRSTHGKPF